MAYTGGIPSQLRQADEASKLSIEELMRLQTLDPSFVYTIALQERQKQEAAAANQAALDTQVNSNTIQGQLEQDLMSRRAPGVQLAASRSMPQPQGMPQQRQPQPQRQPQLQTMGVASIPANNMQAIGRAQGGIIGYAAGGDVSDEETQVDPMQAQLEAFMKLQAQYEALSASGAPQETLDRIQADIDSYSNVNQGGYNIFREADKARAIYNPSQGMAMGGVVGYKKGGPVDMDALLDALMIAESGGDPKAVSRAGAEGAYQIMPSTAADPGFGVSPMEGDRFDPKASRAFARQYLQAMLDRYDGDVEAALIAYNAGAGNADKFMAANRDYDVLPQTMQTKPYVSKIMGQVEREDRRRDFQMGGGRTISTTAPESFTERQRRETKERADRALASRFATVPEETKSELYEPNIPDALAVAKAQTDLMGGPTMNMGERDPRFSDPANYLRDMGARQTADNKERFAQAFPGAKEAVARAAQEKEDGGIGYLRRLARMQAQAKQRSEEEAKGGLSYIKALADAEAAQKANSLRYLQQAGKFQEMQGDTEDMLNELDPAAQGVKGFDEGGDVEGQGFFGNLQQTVYDATKGFMPDPGEFIGGQLDAAEEDPLNYAANATLAEYGGPALIRGGATLLGPIIKKFGTKYGPAVLQRARDLALRATTKPNPAATPRVGNAPGQIKKGVVQPTQGTQIPKGQPGAGRMQAGPPGRVVDPLRIGAGVALGAKAIDAYMGEEGETELPQDAGIAASAKQKLGSMVNRPSAVLQDNMDERTAPKAGLAGLLEQAKPYASTAASIAQILGRGAGASKGFEGAKFVEESARLRAAEQARQDKQNALEAELDLRRAQIDATTAAGETRATATLNASIMKELADYRDTDEYRAVVDRKIEAGMGPDQASKEALAEYRADLLRGMGSMGGMGLEQPQGLPEAVADAVAYLAETS